MRGKRNGQNFEKMLPFHKCTDADYIGFYPPAVLSNNILKEVRSDPKKSLLCLDEWTDDLFIGGDRRITEWSTIEIMLNPCNYIHSYFEETNTKDFILEECIPE